MSKRKTTKHSNPRYLISRDGVEVGYYPGFTSVEAIKRAKMHYGAGKYSAEKVDSSMYVGRGAERTQARERRERQEAHHAERMEMAKGRRNGTHIHAEKIDHLDVAKVHNPEIDHATAHTIYHNANSTGLGFAIGDEYEDIGEAAVNAGWRVLKRYDISLLHAADSAGNEFLVGGDGMGQGAWVIGLPPYEVETNEFENPDNKQDRAAYRELLQKYSYKTDIPTFSYFLRDVKTADADYRRITGNQSPPTLRMFGVDPGPGSTTAETIAMIKARYYHIKNTEGIYAALADVSKIVDSLIVDANAAESDF